MAQDTRGALETAPGGSQRDVDAGAGAGGASAGPPAPLVVKLQLTQGELGLVLDALVEAAEAGLAGCESDDCQDALHELLHRVDRAYSNLAEANRARLAG